ncbi:MAG: hypothetical protein ACI8TF_001401 [Paracoccaceae bacterium]|jgi:hypothetical protein
MSDSSNNDETSKKQTITLIDSDISTQTGLNRRRLLRGFGAGGLGLATTALAGCVVEVPTTVVSNPRTSGITDSNPTDPVGNGRGSAGRTTSGLTDSNPTDAVGNGRFGGGNTGITDSNPTDPVGNGRGAPARGTSGVSDSNSGSMADPGGNGQQYTDADSGGNADPGGSGRGPRRVTRSGLSDSDPVDAGGFGRG